MDEKALKILHEASKQAVKNIFDSMIMKPVEFVELVTPESLQQVTNMIVALIGIDGEVKGSMGVVIQDDLGKKLVSIMLGVDEPQDSDISDIAGEMANMVTGGVKVFVEAQYPHFSITCPTIIRGQFSFPTTPSQTVSTLKFKSEDDIFYILIASREHK